MLADGRRGDREGVREQRALLMLQELGSLPISLFASSELKAQWLPRFAIDDLAPAFAL